MNVSMPLHKKVKTGQWLEFSVMVPTYRRGLALLESRDNTVDLELAVDVGLLELGVGGAVDVDRHDEFVMAVRLAAEFLLVVLVVQILS